MPVPRSSMTLVGIGSAGCSDGGPDVASFSEPGGLSIAGSKMFIADTNNHLIRVADMDTWEVATLDLVWPG